MPNMDGNGPLGHGRGGCERRTAMGNCRRGQGGGMGRRGFQAVTKEEEIASLEKQVQDIQSRLNALKN